MRITWRVEKERRNILKHGLDFSLEEQVFADPLAETLWDRFVDGEESWRTFGAVVVGERFRIVVIVHTYPDPADDTWIHVSVCERQPGMNEDSTKYRTADGTPLTSAEIARLEALEARIGDIDDIPETSDAAWATAQRGKHAEAARAAISCSTGCRSDGVAARQGSGLQHRDQPHSA